MAHQADPIKHKHALGIGVGQGCRLFQVHPPFYQMHGAIRGTLGIREVFSCIIFQPSPPSKQ